MANTKRFTINQHWQQISTGNVTLTGCNTVATYHIYVGTDTPTGDSDYISDTLTQPTPYNFDTPVWVKLNVTNQLDEADMIVIGELAEQVENENVPPISGYTPLSFNRFVNAQYSSGQLNYTSGLIYENTDGESQGYVAVATNPMGFKFIANTSQAIRLSLGDNNVSIAENQAYDSSRETTMLFANDGRGLVVVSAGYTYGENTLAYNMDDIISISISSDGIHIINETQNTDYMVPARDFTNPSKFLVVTVEGIAPLHIS